MSSRFWYSWLQVRTSLSSHKSKGVCTWEKGTEQAHTEPHSGESEWPVESLVNVDFTIWKWSCYMFTRVLTRKIIISRFPVLLGWINIWRKKKPCLLLQKFLLLVCVYWSLESAGISEIPTADQVFTLPR